MSKQKVGGQEILGCLTSKNYKRVKNKCYNFKNALLAITIYG